MALQAANQTLLDVPYGPAKQALDTAEAVLQTAREGLAVAEHLAGFGAKGAVAELLSRVLAKVEAQNFLHINSLRLRLEAHTKRTPLVRFTFDLAISGRPLQGNFEVDDLSNAQVRGLYWKWYTQPL